MKTRWHIEDQSIVWNVPGSGVPHQDHLEMSGKLVSLILTYGVGPDGRLLFRFHPVFPRLRTIPNDTHASWSPDLTDADLPPLLADGKPFGEYPESFRFDGILQVASAASNGLRVTRSVFPSDELSAFFQRITVENTTDREISLSFGKTGGLPSGRGAVGSYRIECRTADSGALPIPPGGTVVTGLMTAGLRVDEPVPDADATAEFHRRKARISELVSSVRLRTGVPELDAEFFFAKLRAGESIFRNRCGLLHSPGGGWYYAATWCNDQLEYAAPWLACTGDPDGIEASVNAFREYIRFMGPDFYRIPSSVIAEESGIWEGAGDRGDAAMFACGASAFVLTTGRWDIFEQLWDGIRWCLEYCRRNLNEAGVVTSDKDEMEGRLPAGNANLCTSALYYGALNFSASLAEARNLPDLAASFRKQAQTLAENIEKHVGAAIRGFHTYRYFEGCSVLRSWIGIPLCFGMYNRAADTVRALFSPYLRFEDGIRCTEGEEVYWDRSALYAFRGAFAAGETQAVFPVLLDYSRRRLLGEHVPYPFEAWPEGNKRHLAAESALYCRIFTEGLFGFRPVSMRSFELNPHLPDAIPHAEIRNFRIMGRTIDVFAEKQRTVVRFADREYTFPAGKFTFAFPG